MATNFELSYNGLTLTPENGYTIQRLIGLDGLDIRISEQALTNRDGGIVYNRLYGPRTIGIGGTIIKANADDYFTTKRALVDAFDRRSDSTLSITLWDTAGTVRTINAKTVVAPEIVELAGENVLANFTVQVRAEDPLWLDESDTTNANLVIAPSVGAPVPAPVPMALGESSNVDTVLIANNGEPKTPDITFNGPVTNPSLTNTTTNESIGINTEIPAGSSVVIYRVPEGVFVELNGTIDEPFSGTNYYQFLTGKLFELQTGNNTLRFSATSSSGSCDVSFTPGYLSI